MHIDEQRAREQAPLEKESRAKVSLGGFRRDFVLSAARRIQLGENGTFSFSVGLSLLAEINGRQSNMSFNEIGVIPYERFQIAACFRKLILLAFNRRNLEAHSRVARTNFKGVMEILEGLLVSLIFAQQDTHVQIGDEVIRVGFKFLFESFSSPGLIAGREESHAVIRIGFRKVWVQSDRFAKIFTGPGIIGDHEFRGAHEQV